MAGSPRDASEMSQTSQTSLVALLGAVGAFLACYISVYQLPDVLCAGIIFILVAGLVLVLLSHEARMSPLRCTCALLLVAFVGGAFQQVGGVAAICACIRDSEASCMTEIVSLQGCFMDSPTTRTRYAIVCHLKYKIPASSQPRAWSIRARRLYVYGSLWS